MTLQRAALALAIGACAVGGAFAALPPERPTLGRHTAELCVATGGGAPSCGPAQVELRRGGQARVRVDDVVYRLQLHSSQVEVVLMHGAMQIDEFTVPYVWVGNALQFDDEERGTRYEVRFARKTPAHEQQQPPAR